MAIIRDKVSNFDPIKQVDFVVDFESDVKKLPTTTRGALGKNVPVDLTKPVPMGSKCYVIATGETYILSSTKYGWVKYMAGVVMEEPEEDEEYEEVAVEEEKKFDLNEKPSFLKKLFGGSEKTEKKKKQEIDEEDE